MEDIAIVQQSCTAVTVKFDDLAVADFFDRQIDLGRRPGEFARVWIHTHPGDSAQPSLTDEKTFSRVFGKCDWAVMAILARGGESYARLRFNTGPKADVLIGAEVDWGRGFPGSSESQWRREYAECVRTEDPFRSLSEPGPLIVASEPDRPVEQDLWNAAFW